MAEEKKISVQEIDSAEEYIREHFMKQVVSVGESLINQYREINKHLHSDDIDRLIAAQQEKLDSLRNTLESIMTKFRNSLNETATTVNIEQNEINDILG